MTNAISPLDTLNSLNNSIEDDQPWQPLKDLPSLLPEAPSLDLDLAQGMIPEPIFSWVTDIAERLQVPIESATACGLSALGSVIGRQVGIHPKRNDDWIVLPNLWCAIVARPGAKKSPMMSEALWPLVQLEAAAREEFKGTVAQNKVDRIERETKIAALTEKLKQNHKKPSSAQGSESIKEELLALEEEAQIQRHFERRFKTNDPTVEKLGMLLEENPNGILVLRDELFGWLRSFERPGHEQDRAFFLEAWSGTGSFTVDRVQRGTLHIAAMCLTVLGGIQPGRLENLVYEATRGGAGDDGLIQRFQLLIYPERPKESLLVDKKPNQPAREKVLALFSKAASMSSQASDMPPFSDRGIPGLRFSDEGQRIFNHWAQDLENRLCKFDETNSALESHFSKYRSLMPALALLFHVIERLHNNEGIFTAGVSLESAQRAAAWCEFLELHARKVYSISHNSAEHAAHALAKKIQKGLIRDEMSIREIYRHHWSLLDSQAAVEAAASILVKLGWVRIERKHGTGAPTEILRLHPDLTREDAE